MTRKRIGLISLLVINLAFILLVGGRLPYFLFYVFVLTFGLPLVHSLIILRNIEGFMEVPKGLFYVGDEIFLEYKVENTSLFPIPLIEIRSNIVKELSGNRDREVLTSLASKSSFIHKEDILLRRRGFYEIGEIEVTIRDVFGIYTFKKTIARETSILVYPEPIALDSFKIPPISQAGDLLMDDLIFQDWTKVSSLRNYREGDSMKSIHWRLWPKTGDLIVKDYESGGDASTFIIFDNYTDHYKNDIDRRLEDKAVDLSLSIINYYLDKDIYVALESQEGKSQLRVEGDEASDLKGFLDRLARLKANGEFEFKDFLISKTRSIKKDSTVIIVTPNLDKSLGILGISLRSKNIDPFFILVEDRENRSGYIDTSVENKLVRENIPVYRLEVGGNVSQVLEGENG